MIMDVLTSCIDKFLHGFIQFVNIAVCLTVLQNFRMYEIKDERHKEAFSNHCSLAKEDALSLGERVAALPNDRASHDMSNIKVGPGGSREVSFFARSSAKYVEDEGEKETRTERRRGVQSLKLKPDRSGFHWSGSRGQGRGARGRGMGRGRGRGRR